MKKADHREGCVRPLVRSRQAGSGPSGSWWGSRGHAFLAASVLFPAVLTLALASAEPAAAQGLGALRSQTQVINRAVSNQIRQAMRPKLQIRNGAGPISQLEVGADGRTLAIASADGGVRIWDLEGGQQTKRLAMAGGVLDVGSLPVSPSAGARGAGGAGQRVLAVAGGEGAVTLYDAVSGTSLRSFRGHQGAVLAVRLGAGGVLATAGADREIRLWDAVGGRQLAVLNGHTDAVTTLAFSASGRMLVSGDAQGTVRLWAVPSGATVATLGGSGKVTALAVAGDERVVAASAGGTVRVWSADGAPLGSWQAESGSVTSLDASRSGAVVTASGGPEAHLWNSSGGALGRINDDSGRVMIAAFSPDGSRVITAGGGGRARVWDAASGRFLAQMILTSGGWAVTDANGRFDGSEGGLGNVSWAADQGVFDIANFSEPYFEPGLLAKALRAPGALLTPAAPPVEAGVGVPPVVTITSGGGAGAGQATVTVTATDQGGGVSAIRLFQNDKVVDDGHVTRDSGPGSNRTVAYGVTLAGGGNTFRAVAASVERIEGQSAVLELRAAASERKPTLHLIVVGINQYANSGMTLNYAAADAKGFVDWAKKQVNPNFARIEVHSLFDRSATRSAILELFTSLQGTQPEDVVLIYLAGHGENADGNWYFLPTEFGRTMSFAAVAGEGVSSKMLEDGIVKMGAQRVFMLIDACKSGALGRAFAADADRKDLQKVSRTAGIHVLLATDKNQLAVELAELGHGAFTYTVLQALEGRASSDSIIRAKSVLNYASETVPMVAFKYTNMEQHPTVFSRGSDFEIGRRGR